VPVNLHPTLLQARNGGNEAARSCNGRLQPCILGDRTATTTVVLYGDSHSLHWLGAFAEAGRRAHWKVVAFVKPGCPSFLLPAALSFLNCRPFRIKAVTYIQQSHPDLVVFSNSAFVLALPGGERRGRGVTRAIEQVPNGIPVAVFSQSPSAPDDVPSCLSEHLRDTFRCAPRPNDRDAAAVNARLQQALKTTAARFIDVRPLVCDAQRCPTVVGNLLVYRDDDHVTYDFARTRATALMSLLSPLMGTPTLAP
jgi:hypothetical protein